MLKPETGKAMIEPTTRPMPVIKRGGTVSNKIAKLAREPQRKTVASAAKSLRTS
jgi:hypothetical protein